MNDELTNLLPPERQRALSREYRLRLSTVAACLLATLTIIAGLLLVPTYVFLSQTITAKQITLANVESILHSSDEEALSSHLASLSNDAATLMALGKAPSASAVIRAVLAVPRSGNTLSGLSYTPAISKAPATLTISGSAVSRDALRSYQLALQSSSFIASADLPVSVYAKDADISFTIIAALIP